MNSKKANVAFFISVVIYLGCITALDFLAPQILSGSIERNNFICEALMVLPALLFLFLFEKENKASFLSFHRVKAGTLLALLPFTFFSFPVITLANLLSQFAASNAVMEAMEVSDIGSSAFLPLFFTVGLFAPFCEELLCRGIYFASYKRSGGAVSAILLSALLFALIHMNFNQAAYAFVMGILAALLVEATGSILMSILYHMLINSSQVIALYALFRDNDAIYSETQTLINSNSQLLVTSAAVYLVITAVTLPFAWMILVWMSKHENRIGHLQEIWLKRRDKKERLITIPLILAWFICVIVIVLSML